MFYYILLFGNGTRQADNGRYFGEYLTESGIDMAKSMGITGFGPLWSIVTKDWVNQVHQRSIIIHPCTYRPEDYFLKDTPYKTFAEFIHSALDLGVDGVFTEDIAQTREIVESYESDYTLQVVLISSGVLVFVGILIFTASLFAIGSRMLTKLKVISAIGSLNLKEPSMIWDATFLHKVTSVSQFDCPFLTKAYVRHDCILKYVPNLTSITLNGEFPISIEALKKLPSSKPVLRHIAFKNFDLVDTLPAKSNLKLTLASLEDVEFNNCSSDLVLRIIEVLSKPLRNITMYQINLTKQICDAITPSLFPHIHSMEFEQIANSHIKSKQAFNKMLEKLESLNSLKFVAKKKTDLNISIPEHVEELTLESATISGDVSNIKRLILRDHLNNIDSFKKVEFVCFLRSIPDLKLDPKINPSLKCVEAYLGRKHLTSTASINIVEKKYPESDMK